MNDLPRRPVEPLPPRPGEFEAVLARARARRHTRALKTLGITTVFLLGLGGGMSLDGGVTSVPQAVIDVAKDVTQRDEPAATAQESTAASKAPKVHPKQRKPTRSPARPPTSAVAVPQKPPVGERAVRGRAVTSDGDPVAGLYAYSVRRSAQGWLPRLVARTDARGRFVAECSAAPVLLTSWPLNVPANSAAAAATWAPVFVGGATAPAAAINAPCTRPGRGKATQVVVSAGATLAGTASVPEACDDGRAVWVWLYGQPTMAVRVSDLQDGDSFRVGGLPGGSLVVAANGTRGAAELTLGELTLGELTEEVVEVGCEPPETPEPSVTPEPDPTPSPTEPTPGVSPSPIETTTKAGTSSSPSPRA